MDVQDAVPTHWRSTGSPTETLCLWVIKNLKIKQSSPQIILLNVCFSVSRMNCWLLHQGSLRASGWVRSHSMTDLGRFIHCQSMGESCSAGTTPSDLMPGTILVLKRDFKNEHVFWPLKSVDGFCSVIRDCGRGKTQLLDRQMLKQEMIQWVQINFSAPGVWELPCSIHVRRCCRAPGSTATSAHQCRKHGGTVKGHWEEDNLVLAWYGIMESFRLGKTSRIESSW